MNNATWFAMFSNAAMPAYTVFKYAQYALMPEAFGDEYGQALLALYGAQFPLCLLGAIFAGVSYIEGPGWRRVLVYAVFVVVVAGLSGFAKLAWDTDLGPIIAWAIAMQLVILMFVGSQPELALARIDAITHDAVNLILLATFGGLIVIAVAPRPASNFEVVL